MNYVIYCYCYIPTGEKYIGQTNNIRKRQREHLNDMRTNLRFHNLLRKHYKDFSFTILEENINKSIVNEREKYWIKYYNTFEGFGFNLTPGGDGGFEHCQKYWQEHPEEQQRHIQKIQPLASEAAKQWREDNPELERQRLENLHQKAKEWRKNNPNKVKENQKKAVEGMKLWRQNHPDEFEKNRKKATDKVKKKVICENTGIVYESIQAAARATGIVNSNIGACCNGRRKSAGKDKNNNKLIWRFYDD